MYIKCPIYMQGFMFSQTVIESLIPIFIKFLSDIF